MPRRLDPPAPGRHAPPRHHGAARRCLACVLALAVGAVAAVESPQWLANPNDDPLLGDATPAERFGEVMALDGDLLAVSALEGYDATDRRSGRVVVFRRTAGAWSRLSVVTPPMGQDYALFGTGVALQGDTLVVGEFAADIGGRFDAGRVHVFGFDGVRYTPRQVLTDASGASRYLGGTIALDGDTLAVSRRMGLDSSTNDAGEVEIHARIGDAWVLRQVLRAPVPASNDGFGSALHLVGDLLVVGAPNDALRGAAYVHVREAGQWVMRQRLAAPPGDAADDFGTAIAGDAQRLLFGAPSYLQAHAGAAFEWRRTAGSWEAGRRLSAGSVPDVRQFGVRIARAGTRWLVGAVRGADLARVDRIELFGYVESAGELVIERQASLDYGPGSGYALRALLLDAQSMFVGLPFSRAAPWADAGEVRVVPLSPAGGGVVALNTGATATGERFGAAVVASENWVLAGSPGERRRSALAGAVYVYPRLAGGRSLGEPSALLPVSVPAGAEFGTALARSGDTLLVGAPTRADGGSVHAYEHDGLGWQQVAQWRLPGGQRDAFGARIAGHAERFVVGAPREAPTTDGSGAAYVIERLPVGWGPPARLVPSSVVSSQMFGHDVAIDGTVVAVAARRYGTGDFGQPLLLDGSAYVFGRGASGWTELARVERPPGGAASGGFGGAVALRGDTLAVGAPLGPEVHVFERSADGTWPWAHRIDAPSPLASGFGSSLRFVGDELWIAATGTHTVYRYRRVGAGWHLAQQIQGPGGSPYDNFGADFAHVDGAVFIGAPLRGGHRPPIYNVGAVWIDEASVFGDSFEP